MTPPYYIIAANVPSGNRVRHFHSSGSESAAHRLSNLPRFRYASFDVAIPQSPTVGPSDSLEWKWGDRKVLRLFQDGALIFGARADADFLGWGTQPEQFERSPRLNPVAVAEVHASFVHTYRTVCEMLKAQPDTISFNLSLEGGVWNGTRLFLTQHFEQRPYFWDHVQQYFLQEEHSTAEVAAAAQDVVDRPNTVAGSLLAAFADWFDMPRGEIPFTHEDEAGELAVDLDAITAL